MPGDLLEQVDDILQGLRGRVETRLDAWQMSINPMSFRQMEIEVHALARRFADELSGLLLGTMSQDPVFQAQTTHAAQVGAPGWLRPAGHKTVRVKLLKGMCQVLPFDT